MFSTKKYTYLVLFAISFLTNACTNTDSSNKKTILSVSIEPQKYFLEKLVGDKYAINTVIPSGSNPESYDPSPSQMINTGKSTIYFKVGNLGFENTWLNNIALNNKEMKVVDCSNGIKPIEHAHDGHTHGDPHIWSSPKTALVLTKNMYNSLVETDKKNQSFYLANFEKLEKEISITDSIVQTYINQAPSRSFIIYHPALSYFSEEYGLNQLSIEVDGKSPTPQQLSDLIKQAKQENVKVVFIQEEFDVKNAEIIAKEIGAKVVKINPLAYNWHDEMINIAKAIAQVK